MLYIAPYKLGSESAKALALALNVKRITGEKLVAPGSIVVNWGKSDLRQFGSGIAVYNKPEARIVEVNSAPGIEGTTLNAYVNIFRGNM